MKTKEEIQKKIELQKKEKKYLNLRGDYLLYNKAEIEVLEWALKYYEILYMLFEKDGRVEILDWIRRDKEKLPPDIFRK